MIRTLALVFGIVAGFWAVGYAQNMRVEPLNFRNPRALAGQVNTDGSVKRGAHFTVIHTSRGVYEIDFDAAYFRNGCPVLTVTALGSGILTSGVYPNGCRTYNVYFQNAGQHADSAFNLIAMGSE